MLDMQYWMCRNPPSYLGGKLAEYELSVYMNTSLTPYKVEDKKHLYSFLRTLLVGNCFLQF